MGMMIMDSKKFFQEGVLIALLTVGLTVMGCGKKVSRKGGELVSAYQATPTGQSQPGITSTSGTSVMDVSVTFNKAEIFGQEFLYGADIQYSDNYNKQYDLYNQTMAIGHVPVKFQKQGSELQLIRDRSNKFPSEVNKPGELISKFKILSETEDTLTVTRLDSDVYLAEVFLNASDDYIEGEIGNKAAKTAKTSWVRSFNFAPEGSYLLQETSLKTDKGDVIEFMETIFPRANLKPSEEFNPIRMDAEDPVGFPEGDLFHRFRLLKGEHLRAQEEKYAYAQKYDIGAGKIKWYVTRNAPEEMMPHIGQAIDGWNRYFKKMTGVEREVVQFMGRLPEGVKIGDPRFNVVSWDDRRVAGAAYESQASDPETGRQSHSLIYMPAAWLQIGEDYWKNGQYTDGGPKAGVATIGNRSGIARCARDLRERAQEVDLATLDPSAVQVFSVQLMKQTLFHEVGHALGLGHNFKGSLSHVMGDFSKPTASIMDYNSFEEERSAFSSVDSADGPLLEYDFQALSAIYNRGADLKDETIHPVLPACNDAEADNEEGGVDPLCIRYDVDTEPTKSIQKAFDRLAGKEVPLVSSALDAAKVIRDANLTEEMKLALKDSKSVLEMAGKIRSAILGSLRFYVHQGRGSVARTVRVNLKSLKQISEGVLPEGVKESELRSDVYNGVQQLLALKELPSLTREKFIKLQEDALKFLEETEGLKSLPEDEKKQVLERVKDRLNAVENFESKDPSGLSQARRAVIGSLAKSDAAFFLGEVGPEGATVVLDLEKEILLLMKNVVLNEGKYFLNGERILAATTIASFKGRLYGDEVMTEVKAFIAKLRATAKTNAEREFAESLAAAVK
jgi:hypothetical protein